MGSNTSADTLFHFTGCRENLINIIKNGFYPRCCMEDLDFIYGQGGRRATGFAIPMVCFCDIPLTQTGRHVKKYGSYALGLSKEWGESRGINPVMYELPNSNAINTIRDSIYAAMPYLISEKNDNSEHGEMMRRLGNQLVFFTFYIKPYQGRKWNGTGFRGNETDFYDEKEWRYIPDYEQIIKKSLKPYIFSYEFVNKSKKDELNDLFEQYFKLEFNSKDIKYIIVADENEIAGITKEIENIRRFQRNDIRFLTTRIISVERIERDF